MFKVTRFLSQQGSQSSPKSIQAVDQYEIDSVQLSGEGGLEVNCLFNSRYRNRAGVADGWGLIEIPRQTLGFLVTQQLFLPSQIGGFSQEDYAGYGELLRLVNAKGAAELCDEFKQAERKQEQFWSDR